jgi:hypothetical protein
MPSGRSVKVKLLFEVVKKYPICIRQIALYIRQAFSFVFAFDD